MDDRGTAPHRPRRPPRRADGGLHDADENATRRAVVLNPTSGDGTHVERVHDLAAEYGYAVFETEHAGHAVELTGERIADGADTIVACGGDGTLNEVVRGIHDADAYDDVTLGVLPGGTGNNFAHTVGIESLEAGFEAVEAARTRTLDVGLADDRPFLNSCVCGLTAESSKETSSSAKEQFGVLAYALTTLRSLSDFDGFQLELADPESDEALWSGTAVSVLIGNGRRAGPERVVQADMEDGLLDVAILEAMPPAELLQTAAAYRLFEDDRDTVTRLQTPSLDVVVDNAETATFSLDGEMLQADRLHVTTSPRALTLAVGERYEPSPDTPD